MRLPNCFQTSLYGVRRSGELSRRLRDHVLSDDVRSAVRRPDVVQCAADSRLPGAASTSRRHDDDARQSQHRVNHVDDLSDIQRRTQRHARHRRRHGRLRRLQPPGQGAGERVQGPARLRHGRLRRPQTVVRPRGRQLDRQLHHLLRAETSVPRRTSSSADDSATASSVVAAAGRGCGRSVGVTPPGKDRVTVERGTFADSCAAAQR